MKKTSRVLAILLALALIVGMVPFSTKDVSAATDESYMLEASGAATAGVPIEATFTMQSSGVAQFAIAVATQCNVTYSFRNSAGETVYGPRTLLESDSQWSSTGSYPAFAFAVNVPQGTYTISVTFDVDQLAYAVLGQPDLTSTPTPTPKLAPTIDSKTLTITKGFKDQIKILNAGGARITYKSSNAKVAAVNSKGKVTAKKKGTATITVKTSTGFTIPCKVIVKDNSAIVEGINVVSKHTKTNAKNPQGGIEKKEAPIHLSNLNVVDPKSGKATRIGRKLNEKGALVRYSKKSGEEIK